MTKLLVSARAAMTAKSKDYLNQSWVSNKSLHAEHAMAWFADQMLIYKILNL